MGRCFGGRFVFVQRGQIGVNVIVNKGLIVERFSSRRYIALVGDGIFALATTLSCFFGTTATATTATATTRIATLLVALFRSPIKTQPVIGGRYISGARASGHKIIVLENFGGWLEMCLGRPIFYLPLGLAINQAIAKATPRRWFWG